MKIKDIILASLCIAFSACNFNFDSKMAEKEVVDIVEMIDAASSDHIAFKGVPIDGTLKQYIARMKKSGFTLVDTQDGVALMSGDFAGRKGCNIIVSTLNDYDVVSKIVVVFPGHETWGPLYGDFNNLKELLTEKYGQPTSVIEKFQDKYIDDDQDRIHAVRMDRCKYETRFMTEKGEIVLWIDHKSVMSTFVCLQYKDKINSGAVKQQAINDL